MFRWITLTTLPININGVLLLGVFLLVPNLTHASVTCDVVKTCSGDHQKYHCQSDPDTSQKVEFCATPVTCGPGTHAMLNNDTETVSCETCSDGTYQPLKQQSHEFTKPFCDYTVGKCHHLGQYICETATTTQNNKCACNITAGFTPDSAFGCDCFSQDSVCGCVKVTPTTTGQLGNGSTTSQDTSQTSFILPITLPIVFVVVAISITIAIYCCKQKSVCPRFWRNLPCVSKKGTQPTKEDLDEKKPMYDGTDGKEDIDGKGKITSSRTQKPTAQPCFNCNCICYQKDTSTKNVGGDYIDVDGVTGGEAGTATTVGKAVGGGGVANTYNAGGQDSKV